MTTCRLDYCDRPVWSKSLCNPHYQQQRRGQELKPLARRKTPSTLTCKYIGCDRAHSARGFCALHDWRNTTHGDAGYKVSPPKTCVISGCTRDSYRVDLCTTHSSRAKKFNLSSMQLQQILLTAACELCGTHSDRLHIDHDHTCCPEVQRGNTCGDCTRGILCFHCNALLGRIEAEEGYFQRVANYLGKSTGDNG